MFEQEQKHLIPDISKRLNTNTETTVVRRVVRKDNTIMYRANRYSVPLGTYQTRGIEVDVYTTNDVLTIINCDTGEVIAKHEESKRKGVLIQTTQHKRNRKIGLEAMEANVINCFLNQAVAKKYIDELKRRYPRYVRDQYQTILDFAQCHSKEELTTTAGYCIDMGIYSANDFKDAHHYLYHQPQVVEDEEIHIPDGYYSPETERKLAMIQTETRNLDIYTQMMEVK